MDRKTAKDFDQELLDPVRPVRPRRHRPPWLSRPRDEVRRRRRHGRHAARRAEPAVRRGAAGAEGRQAPQDGVPSSIRRRRATARCAATWCGRRTRRASCRAILVVHENRGLNPHIEDIARRLALDNFMAFAPDALAPLGGYPGDEDKARELFAKLDQPKTREDFVAAANFLKSAPGLHRQDRRRSASATAAASSTCWRRGCPIWAPAVPFYGNQPAAEDAAKIKAPLLIHYAETDERINAGWPAYEAALKATNVKYAGVHVPGHAARLQQRHDAALRRRGREARLEADDRVLQQAPARLAN